jgi:hypothetical protein
LPQAEVQIDEIAFGESGDLLFGGLVQDQQKPIHRVIDR